MPFSHVATTAVAVNATTAVVTKPFTAQEDDLLFVFVGEQGNKQQSAIPADMLPIPGLTNPITSGSASTKVDLYCFLHVITPSSPASWTFTTSSSHTFTAISSCWRKADLDNPVQAQGSSVSSLTAPSITSTDNSALLLYVAAAWQSSSPQSFTPPGGMTERADQSNNSLSMTVCSEIQSVAGPTGTRAATPTPGFANTPVSLLLAVSPIGLGGNMQTFGATVFGADQPIKYWNGSAIV